MSRLVEILKAHGELLVAIACELESGSLHCAEAPFLNAAEAASLARVSRRTINREIREGRLPARGTRKNASIARADVLAWVQSRPSRPICIPVAERNDLSANDTEDLDRRVLARLQHSRSDVHQIVRNGASK